MSPASPFPHRRRRLLGAAPAALALGLLGLAGCGNESKEDASLLFQKSSRPLAGRTELDAKGIAIELKPPVEVRHTMQYIALAIDGANQWRSGPEPGSVITADGRSIAFGVELEAADGRRFALTSPAFGKELMFTRVAPGSATGVTPALPRETPFVRLHLRSSVPVTAHSVSWSDITNK